MKCHGVAGWAAARRYGVYSVPSNRYMGLGVLLLKEQGVKVGTLQTQRVNVLWSLCPLLKTWLRGRGKSFDDD